MWPCSAISLTPTPTTANMSAAFHFLRHRTDVAHATKCTRCKKGISGLERYAKHHTVISLHSLTSNEVGGP